MLDGLLANARRALDAGLLDNAEVFIRQAAELSAVDERVLTLQRAILLVRRQRTAGESTLVASPSPPSPSFHARFDETLVGAAAPVLPPAPAWASTQPVSDGWSAKAPSPAVDGPGALFEQARLACARRIMWAAVEQAVQAVIAGADRRLLLEQAAWMDAGFVETCRTRIGDMNACPRPLDPPRELTSLRLSPESAFVLSRADGMSSLEEIVDTCGFPAAVTTVILAALATMGAFHL